MTSELKSPVQGKGELQEDQTIRFSLIPYWRDKRDRMGVLGRISYLVSQEIREHAAVDLVWVPMCPHDQSRYNPQKAEAFAPIGFTKLQNICNLHAALRECTPKHTLDVYRLLLVHFHPPKLHTRSRPVDPEGRLGLTHCFYYVTFIGYITYRVENHVRVNPPNPRYVYHVQYLLLEIRVVLLLLLTAY